jgi:hypothetical protein
MNVLVTTRQARHSSRAQREKGGTDSVFTERPDIRTPRLSDDGPTQQARLATAQSKEQLSRTEEVIIGSSHEPHRQGQRKLVQIRAASRQRSGRQGPAQEAAQPGGSRTLEHVDWDSASQPRQQVPGATGPGLQGRSGQPPLRGLQASAGAQAGLPENAGGGLGGHQSHAYQQTKSQDQGIS